MSWYKISLDKVDLIDDKISIIRNLYEAIWLTNGAPKEAPLFATKAPKDPCSIFFSPGAAKIGKILIEKYDAIQCKKPPKQEVGLLIGHDSDSKLLEK
jgi:hypothetical protein